MQRILTGVDADGRSVVLSHGDPAVVFRFAPPPGGVDSHTLKGNLPSGDMRPPGHGAVVVAELWATGPHLDPGLPDPTAANARWDLETASGCTRWRMVTMGPGWQAPMHRTMTTDYDVILSGEIELLLETGSVTLRAGDCVVLPGVVHGWHAGPAGGAMVVTMIGLSDPSRTDRLDPSQPQSTDGRGVT